MEEVVGSSSRFEQLLRDFAAKVSPSISSLIPSLLRESPDPESCVTLLERLLVEYPGDTLREFAVHPSFVHYAILTFGHSRFLSETLIQNSDLLPALLRRPGLDRSDSAEEAHQRLARFLARSNQSDLSLLLARFKRREYFRIMLRDVLKVAPLAETTAEISALSDVLIATALREAGRRLHRRFGLPQHANDQGRMADTPFAVLALGKLGGGELNYSSDVDLIYIYGDGRDVNDAPLGGPEYFVRLAQELTGILSQITAEGPVFRPDLRLRPQGHEGELVISASQALRYYSSGAADWELQALTKARFAAGDPGLAREFIRGVQPFVYTSHANFDAIQTAQESLHKMHIHRSLAQPSARTIDVKLGRGGIRDIEFLVQCLQRVYGGTEPWLRSAGTMSCLQKLSDKQHLSGGEFGELSSAYELFRHIEHRLQLRYGQQTHQLPESEAEMQVLGRAIKPYLGPAEDAENIESLVRRRMASVSGICEKVLARQQVSRHRDASGFELSSPPTRSWSASEEEILKRLSRDAPEIYEIARHSDLSAYARKNLFLFLNSAMSSSDRYGTLLREASGFAKVLPIFESSEYLTEALIRHPEQVAIIAGLEAGSRPPVSDYLFENVGLLTSNPQDPVFSYVASSNLVYGEKLAMLRRHCWQRSLISGARDIIEARAVYDSLADNTGAAEEAIRTAFSIAGAPSEFAVLALGRLGSGEFDVLSDADLIFVGNGDSAKLRKAAEQIVHILSAYTRDGSVFPVDTRLRPRGNAGDILVSPSQLESYCEGEAHSWEALVYSKLRFVAGSRTIAEQAGWAVQRLFERFAQVPDFSDAVQDMRKRLEVSDPEGFKTRPGGIYDIDFLVSFLMIRHAIPNKNGALRDRLWRLASAGALDKVNAAALDHAAEFLRTVEHVTRLITGRGLKVLPATEHALQVAEKLTAASLGEEFPEGLQQRYERTSAKVREIFEREVSSN